MAGRGFVDSHDEVNTWCEFTTASTSDPTSLTQPSTRVSGVTYDGATGKLLVTMREKYTRIHAQAVILDTTANVRIAVTAIVSGSSTNTISLLTTADDVAGNTTGKVVIVRMWLQN